MHKDRWDLFGMLRMAGALDQLTKEIKKMANDISRLQAKVTELGVKADEANQTLTDLAQAVVDLQNSQPADIQADIDALVVEAQAILDKQTVAEDAADDFVPPKVPPMPPVV